MLSSLSCSPQTPPSSVAAQFCTMCRQTWREPYCWSHDFCNGWRSGNGLWLSAGARLSCQSPQTPYMDTSMRHKQVNQAQDGDYHCPRRCTFDLVHFCASYMVVLRPNHSGPTLSFSSCCFADKNLPGQNTYLVVHLSIWSNDVLTLLVRLFQESVLVTETSKTQKTVFKSLKRHKDCSERAYASSFFSEQILYIYMEGCKVLYNIQVVIWQIYCYTKQNIRTIWLWFWCYIIYVI